MISSYRQELDTDGWTVVNAGGSGGGWGPWGGSSAGLSARKASDYFDVQAGGSKQGATYFEVCAGPGTRGACERQSNESNASSGGSQPGNEDNNRTNTNAS